MIDFFYKWNSDILFITSGILINLQYTILCITIGLVIASFLAISKISNFKILRLISSFYVSIFRGTPLIIQISMIYYVLPSITGSTISVFLAAVLSFSLNSAAYVSEIIRSGINSVDKGQMEAGRALGLSESDIMIHILLPQAFRNVLPALINEFINLLKETSLISIIGEAEILRRASIIGNQKFNYIVPMLTAAITYYLVILILVFIASYVENKIAIKK